MIGCIDGWVWETDAEGLYTYASPMVEGILGYIPEELVGKKHFYDLFHPEGREETRRIADGVFAQRARFRKFLNRNVSKGGETVWFSTCGLPIFDEKKNLLGYRGADMDVTKRKQAEEVLRQHSEELEKRVAERTREIEIMQEESIRQENLAALGQLAGSVAHELRNPLGIISNIVFILNATPSMPEDIRKAAGILSEEVKIAEKIISSLLTLSNTTNLVLGDVNVNKLLQTVLEQISLPKAITLEVQLRQDLPSLHADAQRLRQVIQNVIFNAVQSMPERGRLAVVTDVQGEWVVVSVSDTGEGISEENLGRIFEPLFTTKAQGIGLGLTVVKSLMDAHNGFVTVKSEVGEGSTFALWFPREGGSDE